MNEEAHDHSQDYARAVVMSLLFATITRLTIVGMACVTAVICTDKIVGAL